MMKHHAVRTTIGSSYHSDDPPRLSRPSGSEGLDKASEGSGYKVFVHVVVKLDWKERLNASWVGGGAPAS